MSQSLFDDCPTESSHAHYRDLIRGCGFVDQRTFESWYQRCKTLNLLDPEFAGEFKTRTPERAAELFFANELLDRSLSLTRPPNAGQVPSPEWLASTKDGAKDAFYVEVTCPSDEDVDGDRITEATTYQTARSGATNATDHDQIKRATLRLSSSLWDKARSDQARRAEQECIPFVVAISTMGFSWPIDVGAIDGEFSVLESLNNRATSRGV